MEVRWLLADFNLNLVCLQETFLKDSVISFKRYEIYNKTTTSAIGNRPTGSSSILVKRTTFHEALQLKYKPSSHNCKKKNILSHTLLYACYIFLYYYYSFNTKFLPFNVEGYWISIYLPLRYKLWQVEIDRLIDELATCILLLRGFNIHNELWEIQSSLATSLKPY